MSYDELRGNLIAYETTHLRHENFDKKKKSIALKSHAAGEEELSYSDAEEVSENDDLAFISKMILKM